MERELFERGCRKSFSTYEDINDDQCWSRKINVYYAERWCVGLMALILVIILVISLGRFKQRSGLKSHSTTESPEATRPGNASDVASSRRTQTQKDADAEGRALQANESDVASSRRCASCTPRINDEPSESRRTRRGASCDSSGCNLDFTDAAVFAARCADEFRD